MRLVPIASMAVMAGCLGQVTGRAFDSLGPLAGAVLAGGAGLAAGLTAAVRPEGPAGVTWRRLEILAYPIVAVLVVGIANGETRLEPTVVAIGMVFLVRTLVEATVADLAMMDRFLDDRPIGAPPDRIRLRMLGVGLFLASVAGYTLGVDAGFTDLDRPAVGGRLVAVVVWFAIGIAGVGAVSRRSRQRAWDVNGVEVSDRLSDRWTAGVAGAIVLVVAVTIGAPFVTGQLSAVPARVISETDGLDRFVTRALELLSRDVNTDESDRPDFDDENRGSPTDAFEPQTQNRPAWIGDAVLTAIIATVFLWAIRAGRNARFRRGARPAGSGGWQEFKTLLAGIMSELRAVFAGLLAWLRGVGRSRRVPTVRMGGREKPTGHVPSRRWSPTDPVERRIARAFAEVADLEPVQPGETPAEVAHRVGDRTDADGARIVLGGYLRARYSPHRVEEEVATDVEAAARTVTSAADHRPEPLGNSDPGADPLDG